MGSSLHLVAARIVAKKPVLCHPALSIPDDARSSMLGAEFSGGNSILKVMNDKFRVGAKICC